MRDPVHDVTSVQSRGKTLPYRCGHGDMIASFKNVVWSGIFYIAKIEDEYTRMEFGEFPQSSRSHDAKFIGSPFDRTIEYKYTSHGYSSEHLIHIASKSLQVRQTVRFLVFSSLP